LRVVTYNVEADINGASTVPPDLYTVLEGIGQQSISGNVTFAASAATAQVSVSPVNDGVAMFTVWPSW
jgi:hypothetical protein